MLVYAKALLHWNRNQWFCGACGGGTRPRHGGNVRDCLGCEQHMPRLRDSIGAHLIETWLSTPRVL